MTGPEEVAWGWRLGGLLYPALPGCPPRPSPPEFPGLASSGAWRPALATLQPQLRHLQVSIRSDHPPTGCLTGRQSRDTDTWCHVMGALLMLAMPRKWMFQKSDLCAARHSRGLGTRQPGCCGIAWTLHASTFKSLSFAGPLAES